MINLLNTVTPKYDNVEFNISGFGEFGNVKDNPTMHIVKHFQEKASSLSNENLLIGETNVLKVAAEDCLIYIGEIMAILEKKQALAPRCRQVLIHCGVNASAKDIRLEIHGYNNADFRIPDVRDYQPREQPINGIMPLEHYYRTMMPLKKTLEILEKTHKVGLSDDPGRYICNYVYYLSLMEGNARNIPSIFIHVPPFTEISESDQIKFFADLMRALKEFYSEPAVLKTY